MNYKIYPPDGLPEAEITLPLSKSVSNRALIIAALTDGQPWPEKIADCSDTEVMLRALKSGESNINAADAGTAMRFLTAYFATREGRSVTIDGTERMRQRPIGPLVEALRACGAQIGYVGAEGYPPLKIEGKVLHGGKLSIDATVSSQFVSALLMVAPLMRDGLELRLEGEAASLPYVDLTLDMMRRAGADAERQGADITVRAGSYGNVRLPAEADWSAASYWYETEALTSGFLTMRGLDAASCQPDRRAAAIFADLGVETTESEVPDSLELVGSPDVSPRLNIDLSQTPDLTPAVAVTCAMIGIPFRLMGLESLKIKETDRLHALSAELAKIGVETETPGNNTLCWDGRRAPVFAIPVFETYGDHRMAMAFAPVAAYIPGIVVKDAEVVGKSYPGFWDDLRAAGFGVVDADGGDVAEEETR